MCVCIRLAIPFQFTKSLNISIKAEERITWEEENNKRSSPPPIYFRYVMRHVICNIVKLPAPPTLWSKYHENCIYVEFIRYHLGTHIIASSALYVSSCVHPYLRMSVVVTSIHLFRITQTHNLFPLNSFTLCHDDDDESLLLLLWMLPACGLGLGRDQSNC